MSLPGAYPALLKPPMIDVSDIPTLLLPPEKILVGNKWN